MNEEGLILFRLCLGQLRENLDAAKAHAEFLQGFDHGNQRVLESTNYLCGLLESAVAEARDLRDKVRGCPEGRT
jgi:hypothetical protein